MAAFPGYQDNNMNHFLVDSVYLKIMSGFMEDGTMNSNCFYPPLAEPILHETTTPCLDHSSKVALSPHDDKEPSVVDKVENGDQKVISPIDKKRKTKNGSGPGSGSSSISVQSKDGRERKGKKQKQCNGEGKEKQKPKGEHQEPLTGYIHVRARRGQATDSHSLAERVRREKISEKMRTLQRLVPGCDKVSGKALMLDEIISYVQSLQNQVEFLSMKIAAVNPMFFDLSLEQEQEQDSFIFNLEERLNSMRACSPNKPTVFADTPTNIIPNTYTPLDTSAFSQDNANLLWDVEEQVSQSIWIQ